MVGKTRSTSPDVDLKCNFTSWLWVWVGLAVGILAVLLTYRDYGITWDEGAQAYYGQLSLDKLLHGRVPSEAEHFLSLGFTYYGPLLEMIPAAIHGPDERGLYLVRHFVFGLLALSAIPGMHVLLRRYGWGLVPPLATLALALTPGFFGHWFNNSKDIPFAVAVLWYVAACVWLGASVELKWTRIIACAISLGLALCVRPGSLPLLATYLAGILMLSQLGGRGFDLLARGWRSAGRTAVQLVTLLAIAWIIMILPWPWAYANPLMHPIHAIEYALNYRRSLHVLFEGELISSDSLPWHYLLKMLVITTPLPMLGLALIGAAATVRAYIADAGSHRSMIGGAAALWLGLPLAMFIVQRPAVYDGIRHFLFVMPAIAVFAGVGGATIVHLFRRHRFRMAVTAIVLLAVLSPAVSIVRLHPYQSTYFNALVGGMAGANGRYETDYWVASYREAMQWVNAQAAVQPDRTFGVLVAGPQYIFPAAGNEAAANVLVEMIEPDAQQRRLPANADFYIASTRFGYDRRGFADEPIVHTIGRAGAIFTVIKARTSP